MSQQAKLTKKAPRRCLLFFPAMQATEINITIVAVSLAAYIVVTWLLISRECIGETKVIKPRFNRIL